MRHFIESHFGLILLLSCAAGLILPMGHVPDDAASVALAILTYASCFKLRDGGFSEIRWAQVGRFYALRYMLLPVILFAVAHAIIPDYALGVFLLALLPAAVSSPAFAHMFGGTVPPAFAIVIVSQLMAPFLIPLQFALVGEVALGISPMGLFKTLTFCILFPMLAYTLTKRFSCWGNIMYDHVKVISIVLVAFVIALVISRQREVFLADIPALFTPFIACVACYTAFVGCALWLGKREPRETRITYAVCSAFNNVAMGVSLALLHFPPKIILFVAVSEIAWSMLPLMKQFIVSKADASPPPAS